MWVRLEAFVSAKRLHCFDTALFVIWTLPVRETDFTHCDMGGSDNGVLHLHDLVRKETAFVMETLKFNFALCITYMSLLFLMQTLILSLSSRRTDSSRKGWTGWLHQTEEFNGASDVCVCPCVCVCVCVRERKKEREGEGVCVPVYESVRNRVMGLCIFPMVS